MRNLNLQKGVFYLLSCFPLIGMKATVWAIILFSLVALIKGSYQKRSKEKLAVLGVSAGLFFLIAIRCLLPDVNKESLSYLEVSVSLLALPLAFYLLSDAFDHKDRYIATWLLIGSSLVKFTYGMGYSLYQVSLMPIEGQDLLSFHIRTFFEDIVRYHPTYASAILGAAMLLLTRKILKREDHPVGVAMLLLLGFVLMSLLASRTPIAATMICITMLVALQTRSLVKTSITLAIVATMSLVSFQAVPSFSARFKEVSVANTQLPQEKGEDSFNLRTGILKCSVSTIREHWLWGAGPGRVKSLLNTCYDSFAPEVYRDKNFNTHNQFMDYWAGLGILGPLLLVLLFAAVIYQLWTTRNWTGICVIMLFLACMQTENLLTRQNGIVAFCYFVGLFIFAERHQIVEGASENPNPSISSTQTA